MSPTIANVLLRALLITVTPRTAAMLTNLLFELLDDLAAKTQTDLDNKLFELMRRFMIDAEQGAKKPSSNGH